MAKVDLAQLPEYLEWAAKRTGWIIKPEDKVWFTNIDSNGKIVAVAFFHGWQPGGSVQLGLVTDGSRRGLSKELIRKVFRYGFKTLFVHRISVIVYSTGLNNNCIWVDQLSRMGGKIESTLKDWFGKNIDGIMIRFTPDEVAAGKFGPLIFGD